jgi:RNA polymerase sigma-70 factor (ECF subfamily)
MKQYAQGADFEEWYVSQHPRVLAALIVIARDVHLASEAADEAFTRAYERWPKVSVMESPGGWVQTVALNVLRRRMRLRVVDPRAWGPTTVDPPGTLTPEVWDAVRALPERQRIAVALRYVLDLSQADVAEAMNIAPGTASATLTAARRNLAAALDIRDDDTQEASRA